MKHAFTSFAVLLALSSVMYAQENRPNILWIITDDHRADALDCYTRCWHIVTTEAPF